MNIGANGFDCRARQILPRTLFYAAALDNHQDPRKNIGANGFDWPGQTGILVISQGFSELLARHIDGLLLDLDGY